MKAVRPLPFFAAAGAFALTLSHPQPRDQLLVEGLQIWRKAGRIQGGVACATCHSPDGIELAEYNFSDADIKRRAEPHLGAGDAQLLVNYIHALRQKLHIQHPQDPILNRPLQPGGAVLPGVTPAERDLAFGLELREKLPLLFRPQIQTLGQAKAAEAELLNLPATNLKIGIPLNRLSEDVAHGTEHSSIAQWLPESAPTIAAKDLPTWYAAEDQYLFNPSQEELHRLLLLHTRLVNTSRMLGLGQLSAYKFRALLVLQDRMRKHSERNPTNLTGDVRAYGNYNPIWEVGELGRQLMERDPAALGMNSDVQTRKLAGPTLTAQLQQLRVSWFWAGWLSDQGLFKTSHDDKTRLGMWFSQSLSKDGPYPIHNVYANARRQAVISNEPDSWGETPERRRRIWDFAGLRSFRQYLKDLPSEPTYRRLYVRFTINCFSMNLLLLSDEIRKSGEVWLKRNTRAIVSELTEFIRTQDPAQAQTAAKLEETLFSQIDRAKERT